MAHKTFLSMVVGVHTLQANQFKSSGNITFLFLEGK